MKMKKMILILAISALILTGLALMVGNIFESDNNEDVKVKEVIFLPYQNEKTMDTQTMSYGMAAEYSDGSVGSLPTSSDYFIEPIEEPIDEPVMDGISTRAGPEEGDIWDFNYTGSEMPWDVPVNGIYKLEVWGAQGGNGGGNPGEGGYSYGSVELENNSTLYVVVGQQGHQGNFNPDGGGWPNGGDGGADNGHGYGGGGSSDIRTGMDVGTPNDHNFLLIAGGGGASDGCTSEDWGGNGGGLQGQNAGGGNGGWSQGGGGGTQDAGGPRGYDMGSSNSYSPGGDGSFFQGGHATPGWYHCGCGGGGGGWYGGGSGSSAQHGRGWGAGGGGGSAYLDPVLSDSGTESGIQAGHGKAKITLLEILKGGSEYGVEFEEGTGVTYTFTNCGKTGRYGPNQSNANSEYAGTNLDGQVSINQTGIQEWVVPETGTYTIVVKGAEGGARGQGTTGGKGASMEGEFDLNQGDLLKLVVGQKGEQGSQSYCGGGGGGGSFLWLDGQTNEPLITAGGGGGGWDNPSDADAPTTTSGKPGSPGGGGGSNGYGGNSGGCYAGAGGAGWKGHGQNNTCWGSGRGLSKFSFEGGAWGYASYGASGGFGGGAGTCHGGGGGGGYSGGGGGQNSSGEGGGGGGYNSGDNTDNKAGDKTGHGEILISTPPVPLARYYLETFSDPLSGEDASDFASAWMKRSTLETARNERIMTEPALVEAANYTFTNCGATGRFGPNQGNANSEYSGTSLEGDVIISTQGYQEWTVPQTATYTIKAYGGQGGEVNGSNQGGKGARMEGDFDLNLGDKLIIAVGQKGNNPSNNNSHGGGGGGGSYVTIGNHYSSSDALIVAGGGGGGTAYYQGVNQPGEGGLTTNNGTGGGNCGSYCDSGAAGFVGNSQSNNAHSFRNNGIGGDSNYSGDGGFGGGGASIHHPGGGGGGYHGGRGGYNFSTTARGGGSYNDGDIQSNTPNANDGHGMVEIILYEEVDDPGFDSYEEEDRGPFCWVMDNPDPIVRANNLNELTLHIGLDAGEEDVTDLTLEFAAEIYGNCDPMPPMFSGDDEITFDGVAVSIDGDNWYKVWAPQNPGGWNMYGEFDLLSILPNNSVDPQEDLYIKFMQYGSGAFPDETILWDEITLRANPEVEFNFAVPTLDVYIETDPEDPFRIYAEGQGEPDVADVTVNIDGLGGAGAGGNTRADPVIYEFTNCGVNGRFGPNQPQINSAYSGTELDGMVTSDSGIQVFELPSGGDYTIEVWGAQGGYDNEGFGARMKGDFSFNAGDTLKIIVGQRGTQDNVACSGGGGSFVALDDDTPLIVAGGGGARRNPGDLIRRETTDGHVGIDGRDGFAGSSLNNGGNNGMGGTTYHPPTHGGGAGAGFLGDGDASNDNRGGNPLPSRSFLNGGEGGYTPSNYFGPNAELGGFGGGAAGGWGGSGGGGGYSGGGSDNNGGWSGGGGSYNDGDNPDNETGVNPGHGKVTITYLGGGDPAANEVRLIYERADGIIIDNDPDITEITWSSATENPDDDAVFVGDEFDIDFSISSPEGFAGEIGVFTLQYITWDNEIINKELDSPYLRIQEFSFAEFSEDSEFIANKHGPNPEDGNFITLVSYDDLEPPGEMIPQEFHNWQVDFPTADSWQLFDTVESHQKYLHIVGGEPGDQGSISVTHGAARGTGDTYEYSITLTSGPATTATVTPLDNYMYSMTDILTIAVQDDYGNEAVDWTGKMYIRIDAGEVDFSAEVETEDDGGPYDGWLYYEFTPADRALHTFFITPWTYMGDGDTIIHFETIEGLSADVSLDVDAGPVHHLLVTPDWDEMGVAPRPENYIYAGETLYLDVQAVDMGDHVSTTYTAPIIAEHNSPATGLLEPEPWQTEPSNISLEMIDGEITAPDQLTEFVFYQATENLEISMKSGINHAVNGKLDLEVRAGPLAELTPIPDPSIMDVLHAEDGHLLIPVSGTQIFDVLAFDEWGNPVTEFDISDWDADEIIGMMDESEFQAVDYFSLEDNPGIKDGEYSYMDGMVYITAEDTDEFLDGEVTLEVPVRVFNRLNVWLLDEEIGTTEFLLDTPFQLRVPVHYKTPEPGSFPDNLQLLVKCTIYHEVNIQGEEEGLGHVIHTSGAPNGTFRLLYLHSDQEGVKEYGAIIPFESMANALNYNNENSDNVNYLKVEIIDIAGGADMRDFQWNDEDESALIELHAVAAPPASETPSFAPALAFMILALLAGAVIANLYSRNNEKGNRRKKDEEGVSPVIAIILMVAITIVLAGVLWLWVSGLVDTQKSNDIEYVDTAWEGPTLQNDYQLIIENVKDKEFSVEDLEFSLMDGNKVDKSMGQHKVTAIYGKSIDNETIVSFHDGDHDGYLSTGDRFIIKSEDHDNYDGTPDPGEARAGYYFALKTKDNELFEVQIEQ